MLRHSVAYDPPQPPRAGIRAANSGSRSSDQDVGHWTSVLVLVLFVVSNVAVIAPVGLPLPQFATAQCIRLLVRLNVLSPTTNHPRRWRIPLNFITVPLVSVILLLVVGAVDGDILRKGIVGADGVKPIDIMALFISLAYMAISIDFTGLLRFSAFWVARKGGRSGRRLYLLLYVFFLICGVIVGNDPVILSGTAFLAYFTRVTGITPPTAWIFSQFTAANIASVVLVSSNPTNLVLSGAFQISFVQYTAHVIVPFLLVSFAVYPVLLYVLYGCFDTLIPRQIHNGTDDFSDFEESGATLVDKQGAIIGGGLLLVTLAVLVGTSTVGVPVWQVTVPPAVLTFLRDAWHDWRHYVSTGQGNAPQNTDGVQDPSPGGAEYPLRELGVGASESRSTMIEEPGLPRRNSSRSIYSNQLSRSEPQPPSHHYPTALAKVRQWASLASKHFPTITTIARRLPLPLVPFAFLMFILVQALSAKGWVEVFSRGWAAWVRKTGTVGAVGGMGFLSCMLCNICGTNIGATILLARVLQVWLSSTTVDERTKEGSIYALALGSNFGAFSLTFSASLAGLLWRQILRQKGIHVRAKQFMLLNLPIIFTAMLVGCAVLVGQVYVLHRETD